MQKTLDREGFISGIGLFSGEKVSIRLQPAPAGYGIIFQRVDLPNKPLIPAIIENVSDILRCTRLKMNEASVITVEHLLSACSAYEIDNLHVEVQGPEIPAGDGSSKPFVDLIESAGVAEQAAPKKITMLSQPVFWSEKEIHLVALPSKERRVSFTLHYPQSSLLRSQFFSLPVNPDSYKAEIAPCRTFSFYEEIAPLIDQGLIKGGGLENAVVIRGEKILNPGGVRFPDEMVRHKILDLIGDLSVLGNGLKAHIIAIRSGHASNIAFAKTLRRFLQSDHSPSISKIQVGRESHG